MARELLVSNNSHDRERGMVLSKIIFSQRAGAMESEITCALGYFEMGNLRSAEAAAMGALI
jgi:hypothetical protein